MFMNSSPDGVPDRLTPDSSDVAHGSPSSPTPMHTLALELDDCVQSFQNTLQQFGYTESLDDLDDNGLMWPVPSATTYPADDSAVGSPLSPGHFGHAS